jgi:hypothetical protein
MVGVGMIMQYPAQSVAAVKCHTHRRLAPFLITHTQALAVANIKQVLPNRSSILYRNGVVTSSQRIHESGGASGTHQ